MLIHNFHIAIRVQDCNADCNAWHVENLVTLKCNVFPILRAGLNFFIHIIGKTQPITTQQPSPTTAYHATTEPEAASTLQPDTTTSDTQPATINPYYSTAKPVGTVDKPSTLDQADVSGQIDEELN